nr:uncharacterized protein LOC111995625 isoform X2 [Quercus suber]
MNFRAKLFAGWVISWLPLGKKKTNRIMICFWSSFGYILIEPYACLHSATFVPFWFFILVPKQILPEDWASFFSLQKDADYWDNEKLDNMGSDSDYDSNSIRASLLHRWRFLQTNIWTRSSRRFLGEAWQDLNLIILIIAAVLSLALGIKTEVVLDSHNDVISTMKPGANWVDMHLLEWMYWMYMFYGRRDGVSSAGKYMKKGCVIFFSMILAFVMGLAFLLGSGTSPYICYLRIIDRAQCFSIFFLLISHFENLELFEYLKIRLVL